MQKTFCDRCGAECVNYYATLNVQAVHQTSSGQMVAEEFPPGPAPQLCRVCKDSLEAWYGKALVLSEAEAEELARQREAQDAADSIEERAVDDQPRIRRWTEDDIPPRPRPHV